MLSVARNVFGYKKMKTFSWNMSLEYISKG